MIRWLKRAEIDSVKWDSTVDSSPHGMVYAKSWYLDVVSPGWQALIEDDYRAVFPLTQRKKFGFHYLFQPFFTQQLGLFSSTIPSQEKVSSFLEQIPGYFRLVEIQLNTENRFSGPGYAVIERPTYHLDLADDYENLRKRYSENLVRNLKRAAQQGIAITEAFSTEALIRLFRFNRGKDVAVLKDADYAVLEKLSAEAAKRGLLTRAGITIDGKLEAGALFLHSNHEYIFLFSATGTKARESGAMAMIIDRFIQAHAKEKMILDFEGSADPGLARFYKSFGSKEVVYLQLKKNNLPLPLRWLK